MTTPTKTEKDVDVIRTINVHDEIAKAFEAGRKAERMNVIRLIASYASVQAGHGNDAVVRACDVLIVELEDASHLPPTTKE